MSGAPWQAAWEHRRCSDKLTETLPRLHSYVAYIIFQFQVLAYKIFAPSKWMAWCLIVWGLASTLQSTAHNWSALMACRWWLGVSEAGYGTGVILYYR